MTERIKPQQGSVLARWSRLKREAREKETAPGPAKGLASTSGGNLAADAIAPPAALPSAATSITAPAVPASADGLPPVESLTMDSDFTAFLQPNIDEALKRQALKQLFRDPHFNVMDGLDIYIDDYTQPDPIAPEIVREMVQGRYIFNPPPTRINAQGHVEDVPPEELAALEWDAKTAAPEALAEANAVASAELPPPEPDVAAVSQLPLPLVSAPAATGETGSDSVADASVDRPEKDPAAR